ncbi:hypothetical protein DUI87_10716 [Hirundo rustica rustica]|uniref:Uncharacterized protein n=1 Tax=Hirundo rustica rustica TaxID=333673 RepID=A0A3M0KJD1_HIRRU|nr:hypothetical protein DUI87_10716 [Hirundo rustica rustica]
MTYSVSWDRKGIALEVLGQTIRGKPTGLMKQGPAENHKICLYDAHFGGSILLREKFFKMDLCRWVPRTPVRRRPQASSDVFTAADAYKVRAAGPGKQPPHVGPWIPTPAMGLDNTLDNGGNQKSRHS